jgi:hypothetical protein
MVTLRPQTVDAIPPAAPRICIVVITDGNNAVDALSGLTLVGIPVIWDWPNALPGHHVNCAAN